MGEMHGVPVMLAIDESIGASTDFGNVSCVCLSLVLADETGLARPSRYVAPLH